MKTIKKLLNRCKPGRLQRAVLNKQLEAFKAAPMEELIQKDISGLSPIQYAIREKVLVDLPLEVLRKVPLSHWVSDFGKKGELFNEHFGVPDREIHTTLEVCFIKKQEKAIPWNYFKLQDLEDNKKRILEAIRNYPLIEVAIRSALKRVERKKDLKKEKGINVEIER